MHHFSFVWCLALTSNASYYNNVPSLQEVFKLGHNSKLKVYDIISITKVVVVMLNLFVVKIMFVYMSGINVFMLLSVLKGKHNYC